MLEQNTPKNPPPSKKSQPVQSNKKREQEDNLQFVSEKHFDDLASENKLSARLADKENEPQQFKITLPQNIQCIFEFLAPFKGTHYLVGSMVLQLLAEEYHLYPIVAHDADFISTCTDRASLIIKTQAISHDRQSFTTHKTRPRLTFACFKIHGIWV
jgi:hypothetical protein